MPRSMRASPICLYDIPRRRSFFASAAMSCLLVFPVRARVRLADVGVALAWEQAVRRRGRSTNLVSVSSRRYAHPVSSSVCTHHSPSAPPASTRSTRRHESRE